jgi:membrane AbrB-like protein
VHRRLISAGASEWLRGGTGLAVGVVAGWVCSRLRTPIPWMLGPLVTLAVLRVAGVAIGALPGGRQVGQWIIGTSLGLYFTPQVVREVAGWWWLLVAGAAFAIGLGYAGGVLLARLAGIDRTTGIFASVPGGAAEMSVLGERFGARVDRVAAAQSLRILIVVVTIPFAYAALGLHGVDAYVPGTTQFDGAGYAVLMAGTLVGSGLAQRLGVPNAFVLGSLAVAIPLTAAKIDLSAVPALASNTGQLLLGCALGSRFEPDFLAGRGERRGGDRTLSRRRDGAGRADRPPSGDRRARHGARRHRGDVHHGQGVAARRAAGHRVPGHPRRRIAAVDGTRFRARQGLAPCAGRAIAMSEADNRALRGFADFCGRP